MFEDETVEATGVLVVQLGSHARWTAGRLIAVVFGLGHWSGGGGMGGMGGWVTVRGVVGLGERLSVPTTPSHLLFPALVKALPLVGHQQLARLNDRCATHTPAPQQDRLQSELHTQPEQQEEQVHSLHVPKRDVGLLTLSTASRVVKAKRHSAGVAVSEEERPFVLA